MEDAIIVCSDIHGDATGFELLCDRFAGSDIYVVGDITGTSGDVQRLSDLIREHASVVVYGNHDARHRPDWPVSAADYEPGGQDELRYAQDTYTENTLAWLGGLPERIVTDEIAMAHANPFAPDRNYCGYPAENYLYKRSWLTATGDLDGRLMLIGHTHIQGSLSIDKFPGRSGTVVNPGALQEGYFAQVSLATHEVKFGDLYSG